MATPPSATGFGSHRHGGGIQTVLVPLDGGKRSQRSIEVACRMAARFNAHVIGLFVQPAYFIPPELGMYGSTVPLALIEEKMGEVAQAASALFDSGASVGTGGSLEWRNASHEAARPVTNVLPLLQMASKVTVMSLMDTRVFER